MASFNISETQPKQERNKDLEESKSFSEMVNQTVTITNYQLVQVGEHEFVVMDTDKGKIATSGKAIKDQLSGAKSHFDEGKTSKVRLIMRKGKYHYLEDAE